ncbi:MAG: hypothetical protein JO044_18090 [Mycobacteriaceae bacterium]|nr:hypothetical protein [Mycobacteriaceae bacterium]MBV9640268.1 hypothetical protein [Mycobacteriaceae bacterium]
MWCPSVSLSVWANAWLAGTAAPDDVLDALSDWAPKHSVTAYDAVAAGRTGLPWPDVDGAGAVSLLQTLRTATDRRAAPQPAIGIVLPVPGDVRGLPGGTQFARDALAAGEAVVVSGERGVAIGLVPEFQYDEEEPDALAWTVYSLPSLPVAVPVDLGEAEYALRSAVRSAADTLGAIRFGYGGADVADPRGLVEQVLECSRGHRAPDGAPPRALRVLENAAHVDAIITVSAGLTPIGTQTASEAQIANEALRPLSDVVRSARMAAVAAILASAWRR